MDDPCLADSSVRTGSATDTEATLSAGAEGVLSATATTGISVTPIGSEPLFSTTFSTCPPLKQELLQRSARTFR